MSAYLRLSVRFLDSRFHGRGDGGRPEWPPSPLRLFQALTAAAAQYSAAGLAPHDQAALRWLERQPAPLIVAPTVTVASGYRLSVPNNAMDIVARAWARGNESQTGDASPATHRTMKPVRPSLLIGGEGVHYLWPVAEHTESSVQGYVAEIARLAGRMIILGWGADFVAGYADWLSLQGAIDLPGDRWRSSGAATDAGLRVPIDGTLDDLIRRHGEFLRRLGPESFMAPSPLAIFSSLEYRKETDPAERPFAAFSLLNVDSSDFRTFDTARRGLTVAGMIRHVTKRAAEKAGWDPEQVNGFVLGHGPGAPGSGHVPVGAKRFAYLPLPSVEWRGHGRSPVVGNVRRVLISTFGEACASEIAWARGALSGQDLVDLKTGQPVALLGLVPASDSVVRRYVEPATSWATVTPVVLPGYDDPAHYRRRLMERNDAEVQRQLLLHLDARVDGLLRKAMRQAGLDRTLVEHADLDWRPAGFWAGNETSERYGVPDHLKRFPRVHVRVAWRDAHGNPASIRGPICLGGGRFYGIGLFASVNP